MKHRLGRVLAAALVALAALLVASPALAVYEEVPVYGRWDANKDPFDGKVHKADGSVVEGYTVDMSGANFPVEMIGGNIKVNDDNVVTYVPKGNGFPNMEGTEDPYVNPYTGATEPWYYYNFTNIPDNVQLAGWFYEDGGKWVRIKEFDTLPDHPVTIRANYRITDLKLTGCKDNNFYVPAGGEFKVPGMTTTHRWTLVNQDADKVMYQSISNIYYEAGTHEFRNGSTWGDDRAIGVYGYDVRDRLLDEQGKVYNPFEYYDSYENEWCTANPFTYETNDDNWFANSLNSSWDVTFRADPRLPEGTVIHFRVSMPPYEQRQMGDDPMRPNVGSFTVTIGEAPKEPEPTTVSIWRVYNLETGEHLYTPYASERDSLDATPEWKSEGLGWNAPATGKPVWRLFNLRSGDHLYTDDPNERATLLDNGEWVADNGGAPLFYSGGDTPLYRLFQYGTGRHLITKSTEEYYGLPADQWLQEGVKLHAVS